MSLFEKIKNDRMIALKGGAEILKNLLSSLIADSTRKNKIPSDDEIISVIKKFMDNNRQNLCLSNIPDEKRTVWEYENTILNSYLPTQLSLIEIQDIINKAVKEDNLSFQLKTVMPYFDSKYKGQYDKKMLSDYVKSIVSSAN